MAFIVFFFITTKTVFGRNVFSVGGNAKAAELSGINTRKTVMQVFVMMGFMTSIAAIISLGTNGSVQGQTGVGEELNAIASVFIGGASAYGGIGTVANTFLGAVILSMINTVFDLLSVNASLRSVIKGVILIVAVAYDVLFGKRR